MEDRQQAERTVGSLWRVESVTGPEAFPLIPPAFTLRPLFQAKTPSQSGKRPLLAQDLGHVRTVEKSQDGEQLMGSEGSYEKSPRTKESPH